MDPNKEIEGFEEFADDPSSVDDFLRELEAKERDLQISGEINLIEIADAFPADEIPDFIREDLASQLGGSSAAAAPAFDDRTAKLESENETLRSRLEVIETERTELMEIARRRSRDFDSLKARNDRERNDFVAERTNAFIVQMLPVLDNLNRAVEFAMSMPEEKREGFQQFFNGISMVTKQVNELLAGMGVEPIIAVGEPFDPHLHEAVAVESSTEFPPNTVSEELLCGYRIGDRVIRHSMVKVVGHNPEFDASLKTSPDEE
jgi:molecular chaperone GrpE